MTSNHVRAAAWLATIGLSPHARRQIALEAVDRILGGIRPTVGTEMDLGARSRLLAGVAGEVLHRDLEHAGFLKGATLTATLLGQGGSGRLTAGRIPWSSAMSAFVTSATLIAHPATDIARREVWRSDSLPCSRR